MDNKKYMKKGFTQGTIGAVIMLVVGSGICVMVLIFVGVLSGTTYQLSEDKLDTITNTTVKESVVNGILSGFEGLETVGDYFPLMVLAIIITLILALILSLGSGVGMGGRGGAL